MVGGIYLTPKNNTASMRRRLVFPSIMEYNHSFVIRYLPQQIDSNDVCEELMLHEHHQLIIIVP